MTDYAHHLVENALSHHCHNITTGTSTTLATAIPIPPAAASHTANTRTAFTHHPRAAAPIVITAPWRQKCLRRRVSSPPPPSPPPPPSTTTPHRPPVALCCRLSRRRSSRHRHCPRHRRPLWRSPVPPSPHRPLPMSPVSPVSLPPPPPPSSPDRTYNTDTHPPAPKRCSAEESPEVGGFYRLPWLLYLNFTHSVHTCRRFSSPFNALSSAYGDSIYPHSSTCSNSTSLDGRADVFSVSLSPPPKKIENGSYYQTSTNFILPSKPIKQLGKDELEALEKKRQTKNNLEYYEDYEYGGYKPINIGEIMVDRYEVVRKLGYGHFSTVWLCQDLNQNTKKSYTAVKVVKAAQNFTAVATDEIKFLNSIMAHDMDHSGRQFIIQMLDFFTVESVNGKHLCISFELMGPSLLHLIQQSDYQGISIPAIKHILKQVAHGLMYLHVVCKIIHTDIKPENILIKANENYIREMVQLCERYNELGITMPRDYHCADAWENYMKYHNEQNDNVPIQNGESKTFVRWNSFPNIGSLESRNELHNRVIDLKTPMFVNPAIEVKIADLGNGCYVDTPFSSQIQTKQYRALEVLLGTGYSFPADIWSLGCLVFELATGEYLFNPKRTANFNSREDHILQIYELFGGIPAYIASKGDKQKHYFNVRGELIIADPTELRLWPTEDVLVEKYKFRKVDAIPLAEIINSMVELDPELRFTAEDIHKSTFCNTP